jgi:hypothetical protein
MLQPQISEGLAMSFPSVPAQYEFAILPGEAGDPRLKHHYEVECEQTLLKLFLPKIPINPCSNLSLHLGPKKFLGLKANKSTHNYGIKRTLTYQEFDTKKTIAKI